MNKEVEEGLFGLGVYCCTKRLQDAVSSEERVLLIGTTNIS